MREPDGTPIAYQCAECGGAVEMIDGKPVRACGHDTAGILACMTAVATGIGGLES